MKVVARANFSDKPVDIVCKHPISMWPVKGYLSYLGAVAGREVYQVDLTQDIPIQAGMEDPSYWIMAVTDNVSAVEGAETILNRIEEDSEGNTPTVLLSIVTLSKNAIVVFKETVGRRVAELAHYKNGVKTGMEPAVMLATGLYKNDARPKVYQSPTPMKS